MKTVTLLLVYGLCLIGSNFPKPLEGKSSTPSSVVESQFVTPAHCLEPGELEKSITTFKSYLAGTELFNVESSLLRTSKGLHNAAKKSSRP